MKRTRRSRAGPDSVWRILRRLAREARKHEEWLRRFEVEERARERAFQRRMRSREAAWREQLAREKSEREAREAAWRARMQEEREQRAAEEARARQEREAKETAWQAQLREAREQRAAEEARARQEREAKETAWQAQLREAREQREAEEIRGREEREAKESAWQARMQKEKEQRQAEETRRQAEYEAERERADRKLQRAIHRMIGDGDEQFGRLMEALTEGDLPPLLQRAGFPVHDDGIRKRQGVTNVAEFDLTATGEEATVVVEVKTTLRPEDVRHFVKKMERYREWFSASAPGALHGAVAYLTATETAPTMAARRGLLLIRVVGSSASIVNEPGFKPRHF